MTEIREQLLALAKEYNEAVATGKVRATRKVVERSHQVVFEAINKIASEPTVDQQLLDDAEALLMDIRWGQMTTRFVSEERIPKREAALESRLVAGVAVASFDHEIVRGLKIATVAEWATYPRMQIALRNEAGDAYRTIGIDGMGEWLDTLQWFLDRGYTDELGPDGGTWKGCDAVFSRKV
ncbi:hypothetical protein VSR68_32960 [Paraburkholderia phymatum]|uniref:hypothetical protein n=1 Tax=Paraburkholderia phymatum TaxID=148447 RepID=UPI00317B7053